MRSPPINYEFDQDGNAVFVRLAGAMVFVGIAICIPGVLLGVVAFLLRPTWLGQGICGVLAILLVVIGLLHYGAARHFYDLYLARGREDGHDVEDWMQAERERRTGSAAA